MENGFVKTVKFSGLRENEGVFFKLADGKEIAIFLAGGAVRAFENRCPHMGMPLCEGTVADGEFIVCRYHQWKFSMKTGISTFAPNIGIKIYETRVEEDGFVHVRLR